jgi:hypothetical protein
VLDFLRFSALTIACATRQRAGAGKHRITGTNYARGTSARGSLLDVQRVRFQHFAEAPRDKLCAALHACSTGHSWSPKRLSPLLGRVGPLVKTPPPATAGFCISVSTTSKVVSVLIKAGQPKLGQPSPIELTTRILAADHGVANQFAPEDLDGRCPSRHLTRPGSNYGCATKFPIIGRAGKPEPPQAARLRSKKPVWWNDAHHRQQALASDRPLALARPFRAPRLGPETRGFFKRDV